MLTVLIVASIVALIGFVAELGEYGDPIDAFFIGGFLGAFVGFVIALIIGGFIYTDTAWKQTHRAALVSLADGANLHGNFFLGFGSVSGDPSFTWYESNGANSYVRKDVDSSEATIHYLARGIAPYYTIRKEHDTEGGFIQKWGFNTNEAWGVKYDFYVPKGSIVRSYTLDNK